MKREQTAVEWLVAKIKNNFGLVFSENITNEANQIFQQQIEEAHKDGQHYANNFEVPHQTQAEQYYESKYGKDETSRN